MITCAFYSQLSYYLRVFIIYLIYLCREGVACKLPQLNISSPEIMKFIYDVPPLSCGPEDWVTVEGSKLVITNKAKRKYGQITCIFRGE